MEDNKITKQLKEDIIKNDLIVKSLIKQIWECDSTHEDLNLLNIQVAKQMHEHKRVIDELAKVCAAVEKPSARKIFESDIEGFRYQLDTNSISLRNANASSQKLISSKTREQLFADASEGGSQIRSRVAAKMDREAVASKSATVTENLKSVSRILASQVQQSQHTLNTLINSSATATETQEEFKTMGNVIIHSRKLLTKYGRREVTDKVLIFLALAFFFACVFYVIMNRLFWR